MDAWRTVAGLGLALAAAGCLEVGYAVQAGEARHPDHDRDAAGSLLGHLARRRAWRSGTLLVAAGVGLQLAALGLSSVALVQPAMVLGLGLLVVLAERRLGERVHGPERLGVAAAGAGAALVAAGAAGDAIGAPGHRALALGALGAVALAGLTAGRPARGRGRSSWPRRRGTRGRSSARSSRSTTSLPGTRRRPWPGGRRPPPPGCWR